MKSLPELNLAMCIALYVGILLVRKYLQRKIDWKSPFLDVRVRLSSQEAHLG
jgi:uncharacterized membrane protein affecting hemolysin expression